MRNKGESMGNHYMHGKNIWTVILLMAFFVMTSISNSEAPANPSPAKMQLGVLERRLTQLRPLFEYADGKWKEVIGDSQWDFAIVPKNCIIISDGKAIAQLKDILSNYPVRSTCECAAELKNTLILDWNQKLPSILLKADVLDHPLPVVCGTITNSTEGWSRVIHLSEAERMAVTSAFLKIEPTIHVCQQDPKIVMGADPNQRELDIHLQPKDLNISALKSKRENILAEVSPKYHEMCGKPDVFTGRWLFLGSMGQAIDLGYNLMFESYGDFNGDHITDFLFSIYNDGDDGYVVFDGKTLTKSINEYYYQ
jgi:hypothetical protein